MPNGMDLILADHERVNDLFERFMAERDASLIGEIVDALSAHDQAEHAALYPLAGELLGDGQMLERMDRAHSLVKKLIEHLWMLEGPPLTEAVGELRVAVNDHVQDEESKLLPALAEAATPDQLAGLAARIEQNKQRVG
jgi:hemerythrin superfamily protein